MKEQDKLAVIGQMAAGMAHELRNPLTSVRGFIQLLHDKMLKDDKTREYFEVIVQEIDRTNEIINDFLILAKPKPPSLSLQPLNALVEDLLPFFESQCLMYNIKITKDLSPVLPLAVLDTGQIKQVLLNLVQNAIQAMESKGFGELTLSTRYKQEEGILVLGISDTGEGIDKNDISKLGNPFFTTKDHGTGLGLSVSYKIIEVHRGKIKVESEPGKGTKFELHFPVDYF